MPIFLLLFMVLSIDCQLYPRFPKDPKLLAELNDFELRLLRDFSRGRGRPLRVESDSVDDFLFPKEVEEKKASNEERFLPRELARSMFSTDRSPDDGVIAFEALTPRIGTSEFISPTDKANNFLTLSEPQRREFTHQSLKPVPELLPPDGVRIRPKSIEKHSNLLKEQIREPDRETFKEYATIIQQLINLKKASKFDSTSTEEPLIPLTASQQLTKVRKQRLYPANIQPIHPIRTDQRNQHNAILAAPNRPANTWQPVDGSTNLEDGEDWETKMHELSEQLHTLLAQIKETKKKSKKIDVKKIRPRVTVLRNGSAEQTSDNEYLFVASITLIQDEGRNILVDTGLGTDVRGRAELLGKLGELGLSPSQIQIVISTHGHPDHNGGIGNFPDAIHYHGWFIHQHNIFNLSHLFEGDRQQLTENVHLIKTPGHTSDDISVVVKNVERFGNVTVTGDVFIRSEDTDHPIMWRPLSFNETQQNISRRYLLCTSNYLIPGHGPGFFVTRQMRAKFGCN
ncbi:unnamed protein product, partial [Mesorhabditis belari]|uniref:Metallo-beta-lactamase domain-containing protein 1 n=1 Tax=Mesorhabditis belari TaxID=2138241 RepID=A0AAF3FLU6_9BILA